MPYHFPTGFEETIHWSYKALAYDNDIGTAAVESVGGSEENLGLLISPALKCNRVKIYCSLKNGGSELACDVVFFFVGAEYGETVNRTIQPNVWTEIDVPLDGGEVAVLNKVRIKTTTFVENYVFNVKEFQFHSPGVLLVA